jgi:hypothetical protein
LAAISADAEKFYGLVIRIDLLNPLRKNIA